MKSSQNSDQPRVNQTVAQTSPQSNPPAKRAVKSSDPNAVQVDTEKSYKVKKTVTPKVLEANRNNGKKGGPKTKRGKRNSSGNSTKLGLYAKTLQFRDEAEKAEFSRELSELKRCIRKNDPLVGLIVEDYAVERMRRCRALDFEQLAYKSHNPATELVLERAAKSELFRNSVYLRDGPSGFECTEVTIGASYESENLVKNAAVSQDNGSGQKLELRAKFRDPIATASRYSRETSRDYNRALTRLLKLLSLT